MAYDVKYIDDGGKIKPYLDEREDSIGSAFENVDNVLLLAQAKGWNIEWGRVNGTPSNSGYLGGRTNKNMSEPENAILIANSIGYNSRKYTVNGYTVASNNRLLQFYIHDSGQPVSIETNIQYIVIYK